MTGQGRDVPETMESARRWSGFVCPDCRFVFRVPRDHDGKGIVCPSCRRILRIPAAGDTPGPLIASLRRVTSDGGAQEPVVHKTRKHHRGKKNTDANLEWERYSRSSRSGDKKQMRTMLIGGCMLFALIVAGVVVALRGGPAAKAVMPQKSPAKVADQPSIKPAARSEASLLAEAEPLARKFLDATHVEDLLPLVRHPEVAEARMRKIYPDGKLPVSGLSKFNTNGDASLRGSVIAVSVTTRDLLEKSMAFVAGPEGLKVDWESWTGWSEIPWDEFIATKPATGHLFRLTLAASEYYNFDFQDDARWQSYRLESPDQEHSIYGYVEKGSLLEKQIHPASDVQTVPLMLVLKFPAGAASSNQVLIERFAGDGWVEGAEKP